MHTPHLLYPFIHWQTLGLFSYLGYCELWCNKHEGADMFFDILLSFLSNIYPEVKLLDHMTVVFSVFWRTFTLFAIVAAPVYIPTNSARRLPFLHILATLIISRLFDDSHFNRCEVTAHCSFRFAFLWWLVMLNILSYTCWLFVCLWENVYSVPLPI